MDSYPTINFLLRYKRILPATAGVVVVLAGLWLAYRTGAVDWALVGLIVAGAAVGIVKSYLELIDVIADVLIPK